MFLLAPTLEIIVFIFMHLLGAVTENKNISYLYDEIFFINSIIALILLIIIILQFYNFIKTKKEIFFGNSLSRKILTFALVLILIPGSLFFVISTNFLKKFVSNRVVVEVNQTIKGKQNLLEPINLSDDLTSFTQEVANIASDFSNLSTQQIQEQIKLTAQATQLIELTVFNEKSQVIAFIPSSSKTSEALELLNTESIMLLKTKTFFEDFVLIDGKLAMRVYSSYLTQDKETHFLRVKKLTTNVANVAKKEQHVWGNKTVKEVYDDNLLDIYLSSFSLIFAISILGAISLALAFADQLTSPLLELSKAAKAIARGDFSKQNIVNRRDELGYLTVAFNDMTTQLKTMQILAEKRQSELALSKQYVVSILTNLNSGVLTFDEKWHLLLSNNSADKILGVVFADFKKTNLKEWPKYNPNLLDLINLIDQSSQAKDLQWQHEFLYVRNQGSRLLLIRGSRLNNEGYVIIFDDITEITKAQRDAAWGEVAKRLAHEIRNPLMPIQLSAERLALKLSHKLEPSDAAMLTRSTNTIVKQVEALTGMVDAFRKHAKAPMANLARISLTSLIKEIMVLYEDLNMMSFVLLNHPLEIQGDENLLRQVFHNVLQNAQDALNEFENPSVLIESQLFQESPESPQFIIVSIKDNGHGFDESILAQAFEPYVTTKLKGTGLGLAVVKKIMDEHGASVELANWVEVTQSLEVIKKGAIVTLSWPLVS